MAFTVIFLRKAQADIDGHAAWRTANRGLDAGDRWRAGLATKVVPALEADPQRYPQADEAIDLRIDLRVLSHGRRPNVYRILFMINGETVYVHRIRHATQNSLSKSDL